MAFLLFAGDDYYPKGGAEDLQGRFYTLQEAIAAHDTGKYEYEGGWANVLSLESMQVAKRYSRGTWFEPNEDPYK